MAKKKMKINNWPPGIHKKSGDKCFEYAWRFADYLKDAVAKAVSEIAIGISSAPDAVFGTSVKVPKTGNTVSAVFAQDFSKSENLNWALGGNKHGHANAYARHLTATSGKTTHMDYGNLVEQHAFRIMMEWQNDGLLNDKYDFLYNDPNKYAPRFNVSYNGTTKSARPDFRLSLQPVGMAEEAIYDITSTGDEGHILKKKVNTQTLDQIKLIVVGYEILYEDKDVYTDMDT